ncbi:MAG: hypothetical protein KF833_09695 [Verrucomicrobiae bacterium]|nr:hypothetical protein [Verrucomicrobiae bacterium]
MACTIDHLRADHRVRVLQEITDLAGKHLRAGQTAVLRGLGLDPARMEIWLDLECDGARETLRFALLASDGPRNGHMREFFELGEDLTPPRVLPALHHTWKRRMIVPPPEVSPAPMNATARACAAQGIDGPDRLEEMEKEMLRSIDHIGVAASIAEVYAQRMRAFQRAGNEARAVAAFKLAVDWMARYAGSATSGGEGAALSLECDAFRQSLVLEFGYDPTDDGPQAESHDQLP